MAKFCKNCGAPLEEDALFCANCGTKVEEDAPKAEAVFTEEPKTEEAPKVEEVPKYEEPRTEEAPKYEEPKTEEAPKYNYEAYAKTEPVRNTVGITERSIVLCIIFDIITCGIYGLYWMYKLNEEMKQLTDDDYATGGGLVILFSLLTCGIYTIYWCYKMGEKVDEINRRHQRGGDNNKILFLILCLVGFGIVDLALMQDAINKEIA